MNREVEREPEAGQMRARAVRSHLQRVIKIYARKNPGTALPADLATLADRDNPECTCDAQAKQQARPAYGTSLCVICGGISIPRDRPLTPESFESDSLGNKPSVLRGGDPVVCISCKDRGRLVYARFATVEKKLWCPACHKPPRSETFTGRLLRRKPRAQA